MINTSDINNDVYKLNKFICYNELIVISSLKIHQTYKDKNSLEGEKLKFIGIQN